MSNEKPAPKDDWTKREVIPIKFISFDSTRAINIPGKMITSSVTTDPERPKNKHYHSIVYVQALQHYIIAYHPANSDKVEVRMVPREHVLCAEPLL